MIKYLSAISKKPVVCLTVLLMLAVSVFPGLSQVQLPVAAAEAVSVWDGTVAASYAGGSGTDSDPYLIETAAQLAKMVRDGGRDSSGVAANFRVADGVKEIYLNNIVGMDYDAAYAYLTGGSAREWYYNSVVFSGAFDGNGVTVYGIYNNSTSGQGGLISTLANGFVCNVNLKHCVVIATNNTAYAGVLASGASGTHNAVKNISVTDCYVRGRWAAGVIGNATSSHVELTNCFVSNLDIDYNGKNIVNGGGAGGAGGLISDSSWGTATAKVTDCLTLGVYPVCYSSSNTQSDRFTISNVYTDVDLTVRSDYSGLSSAAKEKFKSIVRLSEAQLTGAAAQSAMNFDWSAAWQTTDKYPAPRRWVLRNGVEGAVWSGEQADYLLGDGTEAKPYLVNTAERLAAMVFSPIGGAYYRITADIRLNDTSASDWTDTARAWPADLPPFTAHVTGYNQNTHRSATVYGLYCPAGEGEYAGLLTVLQSDSSVKNLFLADSRIVGGSRTVGGIAGAVAPGAVNVAVSSCMVLPSVVIDSAAVAGGVLGAAEGTCVISDCASRVTFTGSVGLYGGLVGDAGSSTVLTCYSVGSWAVGRGGKTAYVYSDTDQSLSPEAPDLAVTMLTAAQMTGEAAATYMTGFDFDSVWTVTESYPEVRGVSPPFDGTPGEVWTGLSAQNYAGGSGTEQDPYMIATGEQLYKLVTSTNTQTRGQYYKLACDIRLNDVDSENWENHTGLNYWFVSNGGNNSFAGHFDGDYHIVSGLYYEAEEGEIFYAGLFPLLDGDGLIENVGITDCYIGISTVLRGTYAACIVGSTTNFGWKNDENGQRVLMTPEEYEASGHTVPMIRNCFADHTTYCTAKYAGGIICDVQNFVYVDNCFFTGYIDGDVIGSGSIVGDNWSTGGTRITNCYSAALSLSNPVGNIRAFNARTDEELYIRNVYSLSNRSIINVVLLPFERNKYGGEGVREYAPGLDWENVWMTVEDGTPVLRGFVKDGHTAEEFSYLGGFKTTVTFVTNAEGIEIAPITAEILSPLKLPTPSRYGYAFKGWYVYSTLDVPYDRDYMPYRNITLYAKWEQEGISQTFENYPNTSYDVGDDYEYYRPGTAGYNINNIHGGSKTMHRKGKVPGDSDFLINYEDTLKVGSQYELTFWMLTDTANASAKISLVYNTWPDIDEPVTGVELILDETGITAGEWKQYSYTFTAAAPWVSFRTDGRASLYFDDILMVPTGLSDMSMVSSSGSNGSGSLPDTSDRPVFVEIMLALAAISYFTTVGAKRRLSSMTQE